MINQTTKPKAWAGDVPVYCAHDEIVKIENVKPNPKNPNQHPPEQIKLLGMIIQRQGWRQPITVSTRSGCIVKGHGRLMAAKAIDATEVPIDYQNYDSDEQEIADLIADNRLAELAQIDNQMLAELFAEIKLDPDFDITLTGFTEDEYLELLQDLGEDELLMDIAEDEIPELDEVSDPITYPGDVWELGKHRLVCGDSTKMDEYEKLLCTGPLDQDRIRLIITDPPYNVNYEGTAGKIMNDNMNDNAFYHFLYDSFRCMFNWTEPGGSIYVFHADSEGRNFRNAFEDAGFLMKQCLVWVKNALVLGRQDYQWIHEPCLYGWKPGASHTFVNDRSQTTVFQEEPVDFTKMKKEELLKFIQEHLVKEDIPKTVIYEDKPKKNDMHPTMKPVKLLSRLMINSSKKGWTVLDPFGGSGSTLIAAELTGRIARLIEMDPRYADVIVKRYYMTTGKDDIKLIRHGKEVPKEEFMELLQIP